ncbi:alkaline-phosphatase-like protein [Phycomyces nitens]|nr:alkaline-phosphatase-like protein [Phycomyces nitens]
MMISDGMGPASVAFTRTYYQYTQGEPFDYQMPLDTIHVGQSRTRSSSTLVTDSAAGATAFSCGLKTYNGAVGVDPNGNPCATILEAAKQQGMKTGLVVTSRITHATPASFSAHVKDRDDENRIAEQQIGDSPLGRSVDLMMGGGYCHFLPKSKGGCRGDNRNLLEEAKEVDPTREPSLTEMSSKALEILLKTTKSSQKGFFMMIEGSRIDMAAHSNDPATHVHDILEYQNTIAHVKKFVDQNPGTIMISTSDHETGGLSLARQVSSLYPDYLWYPDVLTKVKKSTVSIAHYIKDNKLFGKIDAIIPLVEQYLGINDVTEEEERGLARIKRAKIMDFYLAEMVSLRAQLGWATLGHSGVDVNLYAYGQGTDPLRGSHENIEIGHFMALTLQLNLTDVTRQLNRNNTDINYQPISKKEKLKYNDHLNHYERDTPKFHHALSRW